MTDYYNQIAGLTTMLAQGSLEVNTQNGSVYINAKTNDFTYIGEFGQMVSRHILKRKTNNFAEKLMILAAHIDTYGRKIGGVTFKN